MDSLTHIAIGAIVGDAIAGKKLGKRGMLWGAFANSIPDFDVVASLWLTMDRNLLAHRGFTHSILFALLLTPLLAWLAYNFHKARGISYLAWTLFFAIEIFCHMLLDTFNNYGIGWLEPFSDRRFSFNTLYVFDPFITILILVAAIALLLIKSGSPKRKFWHKFGIIAPVLYLGYCSYNKLTVDAEVRSIMKKQQISYNNYFTTPTPLNSWLWYIVADSDSGLYSGYRSVFDSKDTIQFSWFPKNDHLLSSLATNEEKKTLDNLKRFSQGFYSIQKWNDTLVFNDLRFGQITGWYDPNEKFVFHYFVQHQGNKMAVQRGRFAKWNRETMKALIRRIKGN
jgi:inner membrane protein